MMEQHENMAYDASMTYSTYSATATLPVVDEEDITYRVVLPDGEGVNIRRGKTSFAEDLSFATCRVRQIEPLASHLFALRDDHDHWIPPASWSRPTVFCISGCASFVISPC